MKSDRTLEEDLKILREKAETRAALSIKEILEILSEKGRYIALIFLSIPFCQPIQIPGLSTPFGIVIAFLGLRIAFGKHLWLPKRILIKEVSSATIHKITEKSLKLMNKMRRFMHPRMIWLSKHGIMQVLNGLLICLLGILLALPLPIPLTNLVVGWAIFILSIGLLENDGVFVIIGYVASLLVIAFFSFLFLEIDLFIIKESKKITHD